MTTLAVETGEEPILVEFVPRPGVVPARAFELTSEQLDELSRRALDKAMDTITHMARRVSRLKDSIPVEFHQVEVEFGIKLDAEVGALLSKVGGEATINVTLTWERKPPSHERPAA